MTAIPRPMKPPPIMSYISLRVAQLPDGEDEVQLEGAVRIDRILFIEPLLDRTCHIWIDGCRSAAICYEHAEVVIKRWIDLLMVYEASR